MSTQEAHQRFKPQPGDEVEDVVFNSLYGMRSIELNRPAKFNALNGSMIRKIGPRLIEWEKSDMANVVIMKGAGDRAFCAGGDVAQLAKWNQEGKQQKSVDYFALEYQLDHLIATYGKPYIAFMDGITMGGGVGLSVHAPFRIATERTVFAMPETTIGFFPDVGASFFLPRMPGATGTYLALTSDRLEGVNAFYAGVATHYLHSTSLPSLESRLAELRFKDYDDKAKRLALVNATIEEFCTGLPHDQPIMLGGRIRSAIDRCFRRNNVQDIIRALQAEVAEAEAKGTPEAAAVKEWAEKTLDTLHKRSPTSVHVALRQMRIGREWSIAQTFQREHLMAAKFMAHPDFVEGVTAQLSKPRREPKWQPASLEVINPEDNISEPFFTVAPQSERLELLNAEDYQEYPHGFGLPTEAAVETFVDENEVSKEQVMKHFLQETRGKQGVVEVLEETLARKTVTTKAGKLRWKSRPVDSE